MSQTKPAPKPIPLPSVSVARALFVPLVVSVVGTLATNAFYGSHVIEPPAPPAPEPIEAMVLPIAPVVVGDPAAVRLPEGLHDPHWLVVQQPEKPHVPVVDYSDGNRTAHVSTATPGSYRIVAFGELDGKVVGWDGDLQVVGGVPTPAPPEPSPTPTPVPVESGKRRIAIIRESADQSPELGRTITALRAQAESQYLKSKGHVLDVLDDDELDDAWRAALGDTPLPALVIIDPATNKLVHKQAMPASGAAVIEVIKAHGG